MRQWKIFRYCCFIVVLFVHIHNNAAVENEIVLNEDTKITRSSSLEAVASNRPNPPNDTGPLNDTSPFSDTSRLNSTSGSSCSNCSTVLSELIKPICEEGRGCNYSLNCFNFSIVPNLSFVSSDPSAVVITPTELDSILDNKAFVNSCVVVMFYVPSCEYSAQFSRKFNAAGRAFKGLPFLAVNLDEPELHRYILAYTPVVTLYYRGRIVHRFRTSVSFESFRDTITNMTELTPNYAIQLDDPENAGPVSGMRYDANESMFLYFSASWLLIVSLVYAVNSRSAKASFQYFLTLIRGREKVD